MNESERFCMRCGTPHTSAASVCSNCGYRFPKQTATQETVRQEVDTMQVSSKASMVESTVQEEAIQAQAEKETGSRAKELVTARAAKTARFPYIESTIPPDETISVETVPVCPSCSSPSQPGSRFCGNCGAALGVRPVPASAPVLLTCPSCGTTNRVGATFCRSCGARL
jgi:hypothetical protein